MPSRAFQGYLLKHRYVRQRARHRAMTPGGKVLLKSTAVVLVAAASGMLACDAQAPAVASAPVTPSPLAPAFADTYANTAPVGLSQLQQAPKVAVQPVAGLDQAAMDN